MPTYLYTVTNNGSVPLLVPSFGETTQSTTYISPSATETVALSDSDYQTLVELGSSIVTVTIVSGQISGGGGGDLTGITSSQITSLGSGTPSNPETTVGNVAIGNNALAANIGGDDNVAVGDGAMFSNTLGGYNVAVGDDALYTNTTGSGNVAIGSASLAGNNTGSYNTAVGFEAMIENLGDDNVGIGAGALSINQANNNVAVGYGTLTNNVYSGYNIAIGYEAMQALGNELGSFGHDTNIAIGSGAMREATDGGFNIALGYSALMQVTGGSAGNIAIGGYSGYNISTGTYNIVIGEQAGTSIQSGSNNISIGNEAGNGIVTATNTICIGTNATPPGDTSNYLNLGNELTGVMGGPGMAFAYGIGTGIVTVSQLGAPNANLTQRYFVSDSTVNATSSTFGAIVVGGGTYPVPVWCDGNHWRIG